MIFSEDRITEIISLLLDRKDYRLSIIKNESIDVFKETTIKLIEQTESLRGSMLGYMSPPDNFRKTKRILKSKIT